MAEVVMDDMAIGNPVSPMAQLWRFGPLPRLPYSAVPFPSNWELWRNFPSAMQQSPEGKNLLEPGRRAGRELRSGSYSPQVFAGTVTPIPGWRCVHYDGIVALAACEHFERGLGGESMMAVLLIAGIGLVLAGLLTVGLGVQLDLSFGNTLILAGAMAACTGIILLGIWTVVRELKNIARRLGAGVAAESHAGTTLQSWAASATPDDQAREDGGFLFSRDQRAAENADHAEPASPRPWHEEAASRDSVRGDVPSAPGPVEAAPALKPRRNLLFSSSSRKERERALTRTTEPSAADRRPASPGPASPAAPPASESSEVPPATFDDAWPKSERSKGADAPPLRSSGRAPSTFTEAKAGAPAADRYPPAARNEDQPPVTVLKSGVVDGMAYSLYSDGSIEAQMPEGMMRFASIDELRSHLDQRP